MNKLLLLVLSIFSLPILAQTQKPTDPLAHTFSIVARDSATGEMAVGVQSHWFSVGTVVAWGDPGVGVVATQSFANISFGPRGLQLMGAGISPDVALQGLIAADEARDFRQVALLNAKGEVAVHTGAKCIAYAGHVKGTDFSVQANMMLNNTVPDAMAKAFRENAKLPLAERVLAALQAAQAAGGDIRGRQSAALLVVSGDKPANSWEGRLVDLRVDDHQQPLQELTRLLKVHRAYEHMNKGDLYVEENNMPEAMREYSAAEAMFPDNLEMKYWHAITLANNDKVDEAAKMLQPIYTQDPNWRELTRRLPKSGLLNVKDEELEKLVR